MRYSLGQPSASPFSLLLAKALQTLRWLKSSGYLLGEELPERSCAR